MKEKQETNLFKDIRKLVNKYPDLDFIICPKGISLLRAVNGITHSIEFPDKPKDKNIDWRYILIFMVSLFIGYLLGDLIFYIIY